MMRLSAEGHAGYEEEGKDIICASISTLMTTAINSLEEQLRWKDFYIVEEGEDNFCELWVPDGISKADEMVAQIILRTIVRGILDAEESVNENYGLDFLRVVTQEELR
ncbi:MAG: ribosomal-processing cysteine protease Prp [Clostridiales bacterium]|nr:ribosomal-processing cysteine protease Prp [Candidatus Scatonaster coprocaballi]